MSMGSGGGLWLGGLGRRAFSQGESRAYKTVQEQRSRYRSGVSLFMCFLSCWRVKWCLGVDTQASCITLFYSMLPFYSSPRESANMLTSLSCKQPFSWKAGLLFLSSGAGLIFYFRYEKARMERKRIADAAKGVGKPKVGGPFELVDQNGGAFSDADLKGKYALVGCSFLPLSSTWEACLVA